jgi:hypothetical protein
MLEWGVEYEPYDMGKWSPDFLVKINSGDSDPHLIEVKPILDRCLETSERMSAACSERRWEQGAILVGAAPRIVAHEHDSDDRWVEIGWLAHPIHPRRKLFTVGICWMSSHDEPRLVADISLVDEYHTMKARCDKSGDPPVYKTRPDYTFSLWDAACNAVQWRGRDA